MDNDLPWTHKSQGVVIRQDSRGRYVYIYIHGCIYVCAAMFSYDLVKGFAKKLWFVCLTSGIKHSFKSIFLLGRLELGTLLLVMSRMRKPVRGYMIIKFEFVKLYPGRRTHQMYS